MTIKALQSIFGEINIIAGQTVSVNDVLGQQLIDIGAAELVVEHSVVKVKK